MEGLSTRDLVTCFVAAKKARDPAIRHVLEVIATVQNNWRIIPREDPYTQQVVNAEYSQLHDYIAKKAISGPLQDMTEAEQQRLTDNALDHLLLDTLTGTFVFRSQPRLVNINSLEGTADQAGMGRWITFAEGLAAPGYQPKQRAEYVSRAIRPGYPAVMPGYPNGRGSPKPR